MSVLLDRRCADKRGVAARQQRRLGEILLARGVIDEDQLRVLVAEQERTGRMLGELAIAMGLAHSAHVSGALGEQMEWRADVERTSQSPVNERLDTVEEPTSPSSTQAVQPPDMDQIAPSVATGAAPTAAEDHAVREEPELDRHLILVPTDAGYQLIERPGAAPAVGQRIDVPLNEHVASYLVVRTTRAPLPASPFSCARLEAL